MDKIIASTFNLLDQRTAVDRAAGTHTFYRTAHVIFNSVRQPQFSWEHHNTPSGPPNMLLPTDPITIAASLTNGTTVYPITFNNGAPNATIAPGGEVYCDPINVTLNQGETWYCQTVVTADTGVLWYVYRTANVPYFGTNEYYVGGSSTVLSSLTSPTYAGTTYQGLSLYRPSKLIGRPVRSDATAYLMIGDSNMAGSADSWGGDNISLGFTNNILDAAGVASLNRAIPGDTCLNFLEFRNLRTRGAEYCTDILLALGTNDTSLSGFSDPSRYIAVLESLQSLGKPITCLTVPPRSVTLNSGVQTPDANVYARRQMINNFIVNKGHPAIETVWDVSALISDPVNPAIYRTIDSSGTLPVAGDMLHYTRTGVRWIVANGASFIESAKSKKNPSQRPAINYALKERYGYNI